MTHSIQAADLTMLHKELWRANADLAQECLNLPFVQGLADGSLHSKAFRLYVAQDAFFLDAFFRAYALAAAKCASTTQAAGLHQLMGGVLDELRLHSRYAESLSIALADVRPLAATRAYTDFLLHTAWRAGVAEILAAMTPCMRLYAWLGQELAPHQRQGHPYADWLQTYADPAFERLAASMEGLLDDAGGDPQAIRDAYRYAMVCERDFFAAPLASAPN